MGIALTELANPKSINFIMVIIFNKDWGIPVLTPPFNSEKKKSEIFKVE